MKKKKEKIKAAKNPTNRSRDSFFRLCFFIASYFTTRLQKVLIFGLIFVCGVFLGVLYAPGIVQQQSKEVLAAKAQQQSYWFMLWRKSNIELLYKGVPGGASKSELIKVFTVKSGILGEKPTPLPKLFGREYWNLVGKEESKDNPETAPYFLALDVPISDVWPFGPMPYEECNGQCNWELPGYFGLHGVNGDVSRLAKENPGSSGCVRHTDEDISYLYATLDPQKEEIRYYIEDR